MKKKILLIQSMQTQGNGTKHHLEDRGYKVLWAGSGLTALMLARNMSIDLILLDVALPDTEGMEMCRRFRQKPETQAIPIILLTTREYRPERSAKRASGPDGYLAKPYAGTELDEKIAAVLAAKASAPPVPAKKTDPRTEPAPALITVTQHAPMPEPEDAAETVRNPVPNPQPALDVRAAADPVVAEAALKQGAHDAAPRQPDTLNDHAKGGPELPILPFAGTGVAVIDPATGLFGRPQFEAMFDKEFKRALRFKHPMSLMLIDLDGRSRGQTADEALVRAMIALVQKTIREVDTAAWWSGESFMVLLPNTSPTDALQAAARTLDAVALHPFSWPDATRVTMNVGVAGLPNPAIATPQHLIEASGSAVRRAKELMSPPAFDVRSYR